MSTFFSFADLTWPEVAALPREIPLLIPLGEGFPLEQAAEALGNPEIGALLPALPFGWKDSGLALPESLFAQLAANLVEGLREDGFSRVHILAPPASGPALGPEALLLQPAGDHAMRLLHPPDTARDKVILIPIGHTEQHGFHLPLSTDTIIIEAIAQGAVASAPGLAYSLPTFPYGVSTHRDSFAGTLNCGGRAFEDFWLAVVDLLAGRGFDRIYLISGHGGNHSFLVNVVKYAGERHRRTFCATAWLHTSGHLAGPLLEATRRSNRAGMGHAGELETAMMRHLRPDLVHMDRVVDEVEFISSDNYFMEWIESGDLIANPPWDDDSRTGAYGAGSLGTAENGRAWLEAAIAEKVVHIREIHDQHTRREARREAGFGLWGEPGPGPPQLPRP